MRRDYSKNHCYYTLHSEEYGLSLETPAYFQHVINRTLSHDEHDHDFYEIYIYVHGESAHVVNGVRYLQKASDALVIYPGEPHQILEQSEEIELFCLSVHAEWMQKFLDAYGAYDRILQASSRTFPIDSRSMSRIVQLYRRMLIPSQANNNDFHRIVIGTVLQMFLNTQLPPVSEWTNDALEMMNNREYLAEGVPALLRLSHLSHAQLCRVIKSQLNMTPQQYVKELRLNCAYDMIQGTEESCEDIALQVGYSSFSHFCTSFKEKFGISPAELRKRSSRFLT